MQPILIEKQAAIADLCRKHHVLRLAIFGSAARDDFDPARSDFDFLYEIGAPPAQYASAFFNFESDLMELLGRPVDLVHLPSVENPFLRRSILKDETVLYAA